MANANKVPSDLGGGTNEHLGLVSSAIDYALISTIPYIRTQYPSTMPAVDPANLPGTVIAREEFKNNTKLFREANGVEDALLTQLNQALPPLYLEHYRDVNSQKITTPLQIILQELFDNYGEILDEQVEEEKAELEEKIFDITQPPVNLYRAVKELNKVATDAHHSYTEQQRANLGLKLIKNMGEMEKAREDWLDKSQADMIWVNFESHFTKAWNKL